MFIYMDTEGS